MKPYRFIIVFLLAALAPTLAIGGFVYWMDPYQNFRASEKRLSNMRYMAPGLARHQDYDTVVIGDSMSQNFMISQIEKTLGGRAINLSISGSTHYTLGNLARVAIRSGHAKHIIWSTSFSAAAGEVTRTRMGDDFPHYLYDDNPFNDVRYLFSEGIFRRSRAFARDPNYGKINHPDLFNTWLMGKDNQPGRDKVLASFKNHTTKLSQGNKAAAADSQAATALPADDIGTLIANFDANVLSVAKDYPEIHFTFFVPPHTVLMYADMYQNRPAQFRTIMLYLTHVFEQLTPLPNVTLHYFDTIPAITHNLDNYKDLTHFSVQVSNTLLTAFKQGHGVITPNTYSQALERFARMVSRYDLSPYTDTSAAQ